MSAGARGAAGRFLILTKAHGVEWERWREMQAHMDAIAGLRFHGVRLQHDSVIYLGARGGGKRDIEIAQLLHEHMRRIGHPLVRA